MRLTPFWEQHACRAPFGSYLILNENYYYT